MRESALPLTTYENKYRQNLRQSAWPVPGSPVKAQALKLGLDVHADRYVVVRQLDGNTPQPAQSFTPAAFLAWVKTQLPLAERVYPINRSWFWAVRGQAARSAAPLWLPGGDN